MFKKFVTVLLFVSVITPLFYLPHQAKKTEAFFFLTTDIKLLAERVLDSGARILAHEMVNRMVASTVKWAQSGFDGNPAYVVNPKQYFGDIADGVAGQFIKEDPGLNFLCSPFQANIRISLTAAYYEPQPFQCTMTEVVGNIENFYDDFSQGGWDAWFSMTQTPTNNPYGAYLKAKIELDSRIASAIGLKKNELELNQGFLSWQTCPAKYVVTAAEATEWNNDPERGANSKGQPWKAGDCVNDDLKTVATPGITIKGQLDKVLPSGLEELITVEHIDQLVNAFAAGLLQRYVFGSKGLFNNDKYDGEEGKDLVNPNSSSGSTGGGRQDIDGDGIPDGADYNGDGKLDSCYYGGTNSTLGPPCKGSADYSKPKDDNTPLKVEVTNQ